MFRLWNLLDGRCIFKRKLGLDEETEKVKHKALQVKWEPLEGKKYAILYERLVEVHKADSQDTAPLTSATADIPFTCMDFLSGSEVLMAD